MTTPGKTSRTFRLCSGKTSVQITPMLKTKTFLLLLTATVSSAFAQSNPPPQDVTALVLKGVDFFRAQAATNEEGWLCIPNDSSRVARYEMRMLHYKEIEITIPGQKYEPYEVLVPGATPGEPMRRETRYRVVGLDPSKDRKETRVVQDKDGPIIRETQVPVFEKDAARNWRYGGMGNNGWAILALRRCGVRSDDPLVAMPADHLAEIVNLFGLPDNTHDLAGMLAGFSVMPGEEFQKLAASCASKLMDAQILSGPATGMWGPVAVSTPMVSAYLKTLMRLGEEKKSLETALDVETKKKPGGKPSAKAKSIEEEIRRLETRLESLQNDANRVSQLAFKMFDALGLSVHYGRITLVNQAAKLTIEALPYVVQNQISADLKSTALAVLAMRVAFENGRLPLKNWRPDPPKPSGPGAPAPTTDFPPARNAADVLNLAGRAVTAARNADGTWPEVNIHQPVTDFAWLKSVPQIKPEAFPKLRQPVTLASTVAGLATLANIQMVQSGQTRPTPLETPACRQLINDMLVGKPLANSNDVSQAPFDVILLSSALRNLRGKSLRTDFTTWNAAAEWLAAKQRPTGSWGRPNRYAYIPGTSLAALHEVIPPVEPKDVAAMYDKPHLSTGFSRQAGNYVYAYSEFEEPYFTLAALLFLSEGLPDGWTPSLVK